MMRYALRKTLNDRKLRTSEPRKLSDNSENNASNEIDDISGTNDNNDPNGFCLRHLNFGDLNLFSI
jgi:hypothetical protein